MATSSNKPTTSTAVIEDDSKQAKQQENGLLSYSLTDRQLSALKTIRSRNLSIFLDIDSIKTIASPISSPYRYNSVKNNVTFYEANNRTMNTMLEKQGKLALAPANMIKFI